MDNTNCMPATRVEKLLTGIEGLDHVACGGLPKGCTTLVTGTSGSAKTVLAAQFIAEGISRFGESGVFVTFEESLVAIRRNMIGFGWKIADWEACEKWTFIDASPKAFEDVEVIGSFNLDGLLIRIREAIVKTKATRLCMDSAGSLFHQFTDSGIVRRELFKIANAVNDLGVTTVLTAERTDEYGPIARYGVEEFVADNVIILRNPLEEEKRRRTIEILKFRGTNHLKGEFPFTVLPDRGVVVIPLSALELSQKSTKERVPSGISTLDEMCGGGFFRDSIILLSGATGTGKTLTATQFLAAGAKRNERCLFLAFEESREQLFRNAEGWGINFSEMEASGYLKVVCVYPEVKGIGDHLIEIKHILDEFKPNRLAIDSLSALERVGTLKSFREFVIGLTSYVKAQQVAGLLTATTPSLLGGVSVTETHISTITDSIILLRYVEIFGEMRRGITVLKMRGSTHDKSIREFTISGDGMQIGKPFRGVSGILAGAPQQASVSEIDRLGEVMNKI